MRNLTVYLVLAFSIANLPTYGQDAMSASDSTSTFNIVIDAETREAIANGDSEAVVASWLRQMWIQTTPMRSPKL